MIYYHDSEEWEFYDLKSDPMEMINLYDNTECREIVRSLQDELVRLREEFEDYETAEQGNERARLLLGRSHPYY